MGKQRKVLLYGTSLILGTVGLSLRQYPHLEVVSLAPPLPTVSQLCALAPDVVIFDVEAAFPSLALSLLGELPKLLLIGIDPGSEQMILWSGQQSRALAMGDLVRAVDTTATPKDLYELLGRAMADGTFRQRLLEDPARAAAEEGYQLTDVQLAALREADLRGLAESLDERLSKSVM